MASALARHPGGDGPRPRRSAQPLFAAVLRGQPLLLNILRQRHRRQNQRARRLPARSGDEVSPRRAWATSTEVVTVGQTRGQRADDRAGVGQADRRAGLSGARHGRRDGRRARVRPQRRQPADAVQRRAAARRLGGDACSTRSAACSRAAATPSATSAKWPRPIHRRRETCRARRRSAGLDGVERFYGNAAIDRGPWLLSVGIPTAWRRSRGAVYRRNWYIGVLRLLRGTPAGALVVRVADARTEPAPVRRAAHRRRRSVAARANQFAEPRTGPAAGRVHDDGGQPARCAWRARPPDRAGAQDARSAAVAAAAGGPAGAARGRRPARVRRRARAEQPAAGHSRHGRAARASAEPVGGGRSRKSRSSRRRAAAPARSSATCRASAASSPGRRRPSICATSSPKSSSSASVARERVDRARARRAPRRGRYRSTSPSSSR